MILQDKNLLFTKFHRPPVTRDLVERPRLLERLNQGLDGYLTLVSASAGSGKSTLVSSWIETLSSRNGQEETHLPAIWLSLDENDSDLFLLLRYIIAAMRTEFPEIGSQTLENIQGSPLPPYKNIANTWFNEIDQIDKDFILVLDDYSSIKSPDINTYMNELFLHWPSHLHLVMITRTNPPLPYSKLRAMGEINEIGDEDLRFSLEETTAYLQKTLPMNLQNEDILKLEEDTEGWIAGLQMAVYSLRTSEDPNAFLTDISGTESKIADYLIDEVFSKQPPVIQKFLLRTSILNRFSTELCQAVIGTSDREVNVANCVEWVKHTNLFVIPLDNRQEWYRYHHLFKEFLLDRLQKKTDPARIARLHLLAANWFASKSYREDAILHASKSGDLDLTARLMEEGLYDVLNREDRPTLERWLRNFDDEIIKTRPSLLMLKFWVSFLNSQINGSFEILHQVESLILSEPLTDSSSEELRIIRGLVPFLFCQQYFFNNQPSKVIELADEGLRLLPSKWDFVRGHLKMYLGLAKQSLGLGDEAVSYLRSEYEYLIDKGNVEAECLLLGIGLISFQNNELNQAANFFQTVIRLTSANNHEINRHWAILSLAQVNYLLNNLDFTTHLLMEVVSQRFSTHITTYHQSLSTLALIDETLADPKDAWKLLQQLSEFDLEKFGGEAPEVQSLHARFWLMEGETEKAFAWADRFQMPIPDNPLVFIEIPHLTKARILITRNHPGDLETALHLLETLEEIAVRTHDKRTLVSILATRSMALDALGKDSDAHSLLCEALSMAKGSGNVRAFTDNGLRMREMIKEAARQGCKIQGIVPILSSFKDLKEPNLATDPANHDFDYSVLRHPQLLAPLTKREYDVLVLLRNRMTNKEIAEKLNLSTLTVKTHLENIYEKVGVKRRWDAVDKAIALGILPKN